MTDSIHIDVLVHLTADSRAPADPDAIETARRFLYTRGLKLFATACGVSGTASRSAVANALGIDESAVGTGASLPVPAELSAIVDQITVAPAPELFGP